MDDTFRCRLVTWDEIAKWTAAVGAKIKQSGFYPDVIVGLTRGGWLPARLLCDLLAVKRLYAVKVEHWGVTAQPDGKARLVQGLTADISNNKVLIVDDITDTGESLSLAKDHVAESNPIELRSATVLHITHSRSEPDFYEVRVPKEEWAWFIFPWNLHEDLRTIIPKTLRGTARSLAEIKDALLAGFQLNLGPDLIENTLLELTQAGVAAREGDGYTLASADDSGQE